ncbi:glycosyltransferase [Ciceribacter sp. L1K22]|uniref:GumK N-terminal domain-containing glycosyltransferase n=1 Tax=Ciceribacter sp. L1K22 TaxID=2820275 RepID=UPI001ABDF337|nr:glycosyltransferase [Ciceribacter sp. L1K22]MBO3761226.1 glycosyltransferase [Ciceribacter sp. L1K22]
MKFLFLSTHAFLPTTRKTSVHFVSEALAERGHDVSTISVGYSRLTALKKPELHAQLSADQKNRFVESRPRYRSACYLPPLHPFSSGNAHINRLTALFFPLYGNLLPGFFREAIRDADVVAIESGTAIAFFDAVRRFNPRARTLYFNRDRLDTVGASTYLQALEQRVSPQFDRVIVPSPKMAEHLPPKSRVVYIPQGIDKAGFDACDTSPFAAGTKNAVSVGNMLFDREAVVAMASSSPNVTFHFFGAGIPEDLPANAVVYGEKPFLDIIPFIKFANFGIAPYRLSERELYLAQSSLKLQQYSYCLLPIMVPNLLEGSRANLVCYGQHGEPDWTGKVARAASMPHEENWRDGILTWAEVAGRIEEEIAAL